MSTHLSCNRDHFTQHLQYDYLLGHKWVQSCIDLACQADRFLTAYLKSDLKPDKLEAQRLYRCAVKDSERVISDIEADPEWLKTFDMAAFKKRVTRWSLLAEQKA